MLRSHFHSRCEDKTSFHPGKFAYILPFIFRNFYEGKFRKKLADTRVTKNHCEIVCALEGNLYVAKSLFLLLNKVYLTCDILHLHVIDK